MEERRCSRCEQTKPIDQFNWKNKSKGRRQTTCRICQSAYTKEHYRKNKQPYKDRALAQKATALEWKREYIAARECADCGTQDHRVLEFDHVTGEKDGNISRMAHSGYSVPTLEAEAAKCEIRCANCHKIRPYEERQ